MYTHENALRHFKKVDPILHKAAKSLPEAPAELTEKRGTTALFVALVKSVVSQQLSVKAAETIFGRLKESCGGNITPDTIAATSPAKLRKAGLSAAKVKTIKELAKAVRSKKLNLPSLRTIPEEEAVLALTAVWGIGRWTAEMFLMFALGRSDVFSAGDLGLVRAIEMLYGLPKNAAKETILAIAATWSPYRTHAARILWKTRSM